MVCVHPPRGARRQLMRREAPMRFARPGEWKSRLTLGAMEDAHLLGSNRERQRIAISDSNCECSSTIRAIHYCVRFRVFLYSRKLILTDAFVVRCRVVRVQALRNCVGSSRSQLDNTGPRVAMKTLRAAEPSAAGFAVATIFTQHHLAISPAMGSLAAFCLGAMRSAAVKKLRFDYCMVVRMQNFSGAM